METIRKFTFPAKAGQIGIEIPQTADIFAVKQDGEEISLFATVTDGAEGIDTRFFIVAGTNDTLPTDIEDEKLYLGSVSFIHGSFRDGAAVVLDTPFELHVWEVGPPASQGRIVLRYPERAQS